MKAKALAWCAHLFTSLGLVCAAGIAALIVVGGEDSFRYAFSLMWVATLIDALDGTLARRWRVKEVLPGFDGRRLDDLIDFQTYTSLPLLLLWRTGVLPGWWSLLLLAPLLASAYGFSRSDAKTDDGFFTGFPSYWNIVVFYCYFLPLGPLAVAITTCLLAALTFVPTLYLYSTQPGKLNQISNVLAAPWAVMLISIPLGGARGGELVFASLFFPVYYLGVSWWISLRRRW